MPPTVLSLPVWSPSYLHGGCSHQDVLALRSVLGLVLAGMLQAVLAGLAGWLGYPAGEGRLEVLCRKPPKGRVMLGRSTGERISSLSFL